MEQAEWTFGFILCFWIWEIIKLFFLFFQPSKLNVYKNDTESWDYTNPNLGEFNTHSVNFDCLDLLTFVSTNLKIWYWDRMIYSAYIHIFSYVIKHSVNVYLTV